jgi:hypothetical protein
MVDIARFVDALGKFAWKHGVVSGPGVRHEVAANGDHLVTIVVPASIAKWTVPQVGNPTTVSGPSAGWTPRQG